MAQGGTKSLDGRVVVVTGANSGIGKETALGVARLGATTVLACRNAARAASAAKEIAQAAGTDDVHVVGLDLADLHSVEACAQTVLEGWPRLDVLVNNAGGIWSSRTLTAQGFEQTIGVNHLGPFLLTRLLAQRLVASGPSRVVNLSSFGHHFAPFGMRFSDLQSEHAYVSLEVYARSKLANVLFTRELARRLSGTDVTVNAVHPGAVRSGFGMDGDLRGIQGWGNRVVRAFEITAESGARTSVFLASSPEVEGHTGGYWVRCKPGHLSHQGRSAESAARLWEVSEALLAEAGFAPPPLPAGAAPAP
jgi:NAD(P)-dependent dehydrogenase (short-subunit alcohol dehydrogenase family)